MFYLKAGLCLVYLLYSCVIFFLNPLLLSRIKVEKSCTVLYCAVLNFGKPAEY
jgi:hypothetical protein